ncbi:GntR family transcriptional regulator [Sporosarcina sp. CAU 1771]
MLPNKATGKIKRTFMRDEVYNTLREWIITGELEPNQQLKDQELSDRLGISRTPIREALLKLEDEGLVITKANRWTLVAPIDLLDAENIYSIVGTLEGLAIEQGIQNITAIDIDELEKLNQTFKETMDSIERIKSFLADNAFHEKIVRFANNLELVKLLESLKVKIMRIEIHYFSQTDSNHTSYYEHEKIIKALKELNAPLAVQEIKANWINSLKRIQKDEES